MTIVRLSLASLQLRLAVARFGWFKAGALALLVLAGTAWLWGIAYLQKQTDAPLNDLQRARLQLQSQSVLAPGAGRSQLEERLAAFGNVLGDVRSAEQQIQTLFAVAAKTGLTLRQAEYKTALDRSSGVSYLEVRLPVRGSYAAIRSFCEQTLLAIQFASLDEISFKRDTIGSAMLEAKLRFTLYMGDSKPSAPFKPSSADKGVQS